MSEFGMQTTPALQAELLVRAKPLGVGVPQHWSSVRCACIEAVLSTAILAQRHADVWDAAALLLREHWRSEQLSYFCPFYSRSTFLVVIFGNSFRIPYQARWGD